MATGPAGFRTLSAKDSYTPNNIPQVFLVKPNAAVATSDTHHLFRFLRYKIHPWPPHLRKSANPLTFGEVTHFRPYSEITPSVFNLTGHWYPSIHSTKGPWYPSIHFTKTRFLAAFQELARLQGVGTTEWVKYRMGEHSEHFVKSFAGNASLCCKLVGV